MSVKMSATLRKALACKDRELALRHLAVHHKGISERIAEEIVAETPHVVGCGRNRRGGPTITQKHVTEHIVKKILSKAMKVPRIVSRERISTFP